MIRKSLETRFPMFNDKTRSGLPLVLLGMLALFFFWLTDPRTSGWAGGPRADPLRAIQDATPGTYIGFIGSGLAIGVGLWLMRPRAAWQRPSSIRRAGAEKKSSPRPSTETTNGPLQG